MCLQIEEEWGFGDQSLVHMNRALLGKWLWMLGKEGDNSWFEVVATKFGVSTGGWELWGLLIVFLWYGGELCQ